MNGVDYTRRLTKEQEYFRDALKKNNEAHERRLNETNSRHAHVQEKKTEAFLKDKNNLEKTYQENLANQNTKTRESMDHQTDTFNKEISKEREQFTQNFQEKSKDYDQRLKDIKNSYQVAFGAENENNSAVRESDKNRYVKNVKELTLKQDGQLKKYQGDMSEGAEKLKKDFLREKQQLVRKQENNVSDLVRDNFNDKESLKNRLSYDLKNARQAHESEQGHIRDYTTEKIRKQRDSANARSTRLAQEYSEKYEKGIQDQRIQTVNTNKQHQDVLDNVRREAQEKVRLADNEARRRDNGGTEFTDLMGKHYSKNGQEIQDHKLKNAKSALYEARTNFETQSASEAKENYNTLRSERADASALLDRRTNNLKAEKMITIADERQGNQNRLDHQETQNLVKTRDYERQLMFEKKQGNERINNLKENFHKSMTQIEEQLRANIEDVTRLANSDKKDFTKKENERTIKQLMDMKQEFNRQLDQSVASYEFRLATADKEFTEFKIAMEQKIADIQQKTENQMDYERKTSNDRREAEVRGLKSAIDEREHKHRMEMNNTMVNYQKHLAKMQAQNDQKLKLITNDYETKLKEASALKSRELTEKENFGRAELEKLKSNYLEDKQATVTAYESKLQQLKDHHEVQMQQLRDYKRLT